MEPRLRILIAYYSYTSRVEALADALKDYLCETHDVSLARIRPIRERSYGTWLALSFVPGSSVAIETLSWDARGFDRICLGFPKWTFACPPVNRFINRLPRSSSAVLGLFMSYGGFDEDRYFRAMSRKAALRGRVVARLSIKRTYVGAPVCAATIRAFGDAVVSAPDTPFDMKL